MSSGSLAGFPVVDVKATLYDGSYHDVDSSVLAFQIAARGAFRCAGCFSFSFLFFGGVVVGGVGGGGWGVMLCRLMARGSAGISTSQWCLGELSLGEGRGLTTPGIKTATSRPVAAGREVMIPRCWLAASLGLSIAPGCGAQGAAGSLSPPEPRFLAPPPVVAGTA
jgi:hypothetical protein